MSGNNDGWSFNRFDEYEEKLDEMKHRDAKTGEVVDKAEVGKTYYPEGPRQKSSVALRKEKEAAKKKSDRPNLARPNLADVYGADRRNSKPLNKEEVEHVEEGIDFKGAKRIDDARAKAQAEKDKKNPSGKDRRLAMGKFRPGASHKERAEGHRDNMREKGTSPIKNGKKMFEELQATGLFTVEEIEALVEAACGSKGYQEGGEVKHDKEDCDKCKGKGCDHCKDKKKSDKKDDDKKSDKKPDYIDADGDGDKEEPMEKALKEKEVKEEMDPMVEAAVAALAPLLAKAGAAAKGSGLAAKAGSAAKGMAKDMARDAAMDLGSSAVDSIKSIPGKIAKSVGDAARQTQSSEDLEEA